MVVLFPKRSDQNNRPEAKGTVGRRRHINLENIPWPISVLKFNQAVSEMNPGEQIIASLKDADVVTNLLQLLRHQPDVEVTTSTSDAELRIEVKKKGCASSHGVAMDNHKY